MKERILLTLVAVGLLAISMFIAGGRMTATFAGEKKGAPVTTGNTRAPVIVELFTSEGCSSCPPADAVLAKLDRNQPVAGAEVIPLEMHVDYWNYLGWSDPFSSHDFSARQGEYAQAYGKDGVYTPQMIVDGVKEFPGGNNGLALESIAKAANAPKAETQITRTEAQPTEGVRLAVSLKNIPKLTGGDEAYVLLAVTESNLLSEVDRGENAGRRLAHIGVVRSLTTIGNLADARNNAFDTEAVVVLKKNWRRANLRAVVFAQERGSRRILAAASTSLAESKR